MIISKAGGCSLSLRFQHHVAWDSSQARARLPPRVSVTSVPLVAPSETINPMNSTAEDIKDLLFNQIYPRLVENSVARGVFLESLEPYILSERIGCLTAPVMRDLLSYFQENGMMDSVEGCLVHMDITNLDIQQVVQMCWDNQLYDAMIYVFNSGMNDYISPMEKLFQAIGPPLREGKPLTDEHVVMGNKLLVYISCCLAGRAYPLGDIPEDLVPQVKNQTWDSLVHFLLCTQDHRDLLFNQIYPRLVENSVARGVFLESLEPYILSERIGCLTAPVMRDLLSYFQENGMMDSVEGCLVHMDITNLDIQQVVQMCWDNQLYDAMIYVFNSGMNDYISPMEKLFQAIGPPLREGKPLTDEHVVMGNKLLVYISCCLAGRAYPLGDIPEDLVPQVKNQVFEFLIRLHSVEAAQEEEVYPYIRTLLHFDTREFLNVLALTFEDFKNDKQALEYQQRIVDILLKVMVDNSDFTPSQVGCLFTFLARQLAKPDNTLFVNRKLFDQVLEFLCSPDDDSRHTERQQVLLELLQVGGVVQFDEGRLLDLAEKAEFYQICEFMYEKKHLYDKIVDCYLKDPLRKEELFNYIHNILSMPGYSSEEKQLVWVKALQHIKDLVSLNSAKTAELVAVHFADEVQSIITSLQDDYLVFQFLKCLLNPSSREGLNPQTVLKLGPDLHELLVDLLCQFSPQQVTGFLQTSQDYRLEEAIQITEKHKLHEATAYLLERKGDVQGAFEVLLQTLKGKLHKLALEGSEVDKPDGEEKETGDEVPSLLQRVEEALHDIIALCQRSSHGLNQQQREALWFPLLEAMMSPQKLLKGADTKHTSEALKELTMKVLNSMSSFIAPPAIIQRILQDPVYGKGKLAEIQGLILGMLETFNYEQTLLETTTNLLNSDLHWSLSHLRKAVSRGLHPRQDHCNICLQQYKRRQESEEEIIIFSCGHLYHCQCLQRKEVGVLSERQYSWSCYKCTSNQGSRPADRPSAESSRSRSTSLAQTKVTSAHRGIVAEAHGRKMLTEATLDAQQTQAWDHFRTLYRGPSRLAVLTELTHTHANERPGLSNPVHPGTGSIYHSENFQLKLTPPPLVEE
ncbi:vacuolar protein sorting-associated protein 8 homolog [Garra rufa]|uniref:vacuolar protein sorting-associated protein 8 homolog n=1 Tax=Garra rufa TaxID=137080 RepID=UPI003CCEB464